MPSSSLSLSKARKKKRKQKSTVFWLFSSTVIVFVAWAFVSGYWSYYLLSKQESKATPLVIPNSPIPQKPKGVVYVHVGKTGGEWLKAQLKIVCKTRRNPNIRKDCLQRDYPSLLSKQTVGYIHASSIYLAKGQRFPKRESITDDLSAFTHYLFTIRHPLTRLVSWYTYNHPVSCDHREPNSPSCKTSEWKKQFFNCYPTVQRLGENILEPEEKDPHCFAVLWSGWYANTTNGIVNLEPKDPNHLHWNYQFYWNETMAKVPYKNVLIVRQESLGKDLISLEEYLGSEHHVATAISWEPADSFHYVRGGAPSELKKASKQNICCALAEELSIYRNLIEMAANDLWQKDQTLTKSHEICQFSSWQELEHACAGWRKTSPYGY